MGGAAGDSPVDGRARARAPPWMGWGWESEEGGVAPRPPPPDPCMRTRTPGGTVATAAPPPPGQTGVDGTPPTPPPHRRRLRAGLRHPGGTSRWCPRGAAGLASAARNGRFSPAPPPPPSVRSAPATGGFLPLPSGGTGGAEAGGGSGGASAASARVTCQGGARLNNKAVPPGRRRGFPTPAARPPGRLPPTGPSRCEAAARPPAVHRPPTHPPADTRAHPPSRAWWRRGQLGRPRWTAHLPLHRSLHESVWETRAGLESERGRRAARHQPTPSLTPPSGGSRTAERRLASDRDGRAGVAATTKPSLLQWPTAATHHPPTSRVKSPPPVRAEGSTRGCRGVVGALLARGVGGGMESRRAQPCMISHRAVSQWGRRRSPQTEGASDSGVVWVCHALGRGGGGRVGPAGPPWTPTWGTRGGWRRGEASRPASPPPGPPVTSLALGGARAPGGRGGGVVTETGPVAQRETTWPGNTTSVDGLAVADGGARGHSPVAAGTGKACSVPSGAACAGYVSAPCACPTRCWRHPPDAAS